MPTETAPVVTLTGIEDEERRQAFEHYVNQLHEMDAFIGELRHALATLDEDTVLVLYGDHLPALDITEDELTNENLFQTDYVIWSNFPLEESEVDLEAYQLSSLVLGKLGIDAGLVNKVHREYAADEEYRNILELVGYDMLYGDQFAFGESFPYTTKDMTLGLDPIAITEVTHTPDAEFFVGGYGFTSYSHVFINDHKVDTTYISENLLYVENYTPKLGDRISAVQISVDLQKLSQTADYVINTDNIPTTQSLS